MCIIYIYVYIYICIYICVYILNWLVTGPPVNLRCPHLDTYGVLANFYEIPMAATPIPRLQAATLVFMARSDPATSHPLWAALHVHTRNLASWPGSLKEKGMNMWMLDWHIIYIILYIYIYILYLILYIYHIICTHRMMYVI